MAFPLAHTSCSSLVTSRHPPFKGLCVFMKKRKRKAEENNHQRTGASGFWLKDRHVITTIHHPVKAGLGLVCYLTRPDSTRYSESIPTINTPIEQTHTRRRWLRALLFGLRVPHRHGQAFSLCYNHSILFVTPVTSVPVSSLIKKEKGRTCRRGPTDFLTHRSLSSICTRGFFCVENNHEACERGRTRTSQSAAIYSETCIS